MTEPPLNLLLIDPDPIFRLGLVTALNGFESFRITEQAANATEALEKLSLQSFSLILLEPDFQDTGMTGWQLCQRIKQTNPTQKICLISGSQKIERLIRAKNQGIEGYCPKGFAIAQLVGILQQISQGNTYWANLATESPTTVSKDRQAWYVKLRQSGLEEINGQIRAINQYLSNPNLSWISRFYWQGRRRELVSARWLVQQIIPVEVIRMPDTPVSEPLFSSETSSDALVPTSGDSLALPSYLPQETSQETLWQNTFNKLQSSLKNYTGVPLEIEILQAEKAQTLLILIFNQLRQLIDQLRYSEVNYVQLPQNLASLLAPIWYNTSLTFLNKFCLTNSPYTLETLQEMLDNEQEIIQEEVLNKIPFLPDLFNYLLFSSPLKIQGIDYRPESPEALERAEKLLQNTIIKIANGVMVFILNNFSDMEIIKDNLYKEKMLSTREITKFRNELSWQYRLNQYWETPRNIFESQYPIYFFDAKGIQSTAFYFPRQDELKQLQGLPWLITIVLEIRDAIAPTLRAVTGRLGEGLVYILTKVIGRAIGLVGRGILQGVGSTWQEARYGKTPRQDKS